jgi:hypothetical protein
MADLKEERVCTKFHFDVGEKCYRNLKMLTVAFGEQTMGRTPIFQWFYKFKAV